MASRMSKSRKICLVLFIGIPGSGKTEFCKLLTRKFSISTARQLHFQVKHVCYDDILEHVSHDREWRKARDRILKSVHSHAQRFIQNTVNNETKLIILVDDNNYYQSMRRMYSRVAKKHDYGFCQVYMQCDEGLATQRVLDRNVKLGTMHVTPQIVQQMSSKIEPPNHSSAWESSSLIIDTNLQLGVVSDFFYQVNGSFGKLAVLKAVEQLIEDEFIKVHVEKCVPKEIASASLRRESMLQDLDVALRKQISVQVAAARISGCDKADVQTLVQRLNSNRRMLLKTYSSRAITLETIDFIVNDFAKITTVV